MARLWTGVAILGVLAGVAVGLHFRKDPCQEAGWDKQDPTKSCIWHSRADPEGMIYSTSFDQRFDAWKDVRASEARIRQGLRESKECRQEIMAQGRNLDNKEMLCPKAMSKWPIEDNQK